MKTKMLAFAVSLLGMTAVSCATTTAASGASKPYTKTVCAVSDNELGSMGPVITEVYKGQEIKFCCKPCVKKFHADPEKYLSAL